MPVETWHQARIRNHFWNVNIQEPDVDRYVSWPMFVQSYFPTSCFRKTLLVDYYTDSARALKSDTKNTEPYYNSPFQGGGISMYLRV